MLNFKDKQHALVALPDTSWIWPALIILSAIAATLVNFVFVDIPMRPFVMLWFLCLCPGMACVLFLRLKEPVVEWVLAVALSLALEGVVTAIQLYAGWWSPAGTLSILVVLCMGAAIAQLIVKR